eukprot:jgi/Mesen1/4755/ME000242S03927
MSANISVMLAIHGKRPSSVDFYKPLRHYIASHYSEREAQDAEEDLQAIQRMRSDIEKQADALEARRDLLQRFFRALTVIETRFPISSEREHVNQLHFVWYDAFKQGKKGSQQNIHFEKAGICFNLGATQSQLGLAADRSSANGLKQACNCFQASAGAFAFLRDSISMKASGGGSGSSTTIDISVECAGMLERLMLAQAQECFYEKVIADGKPSALVGKVARQVGMYYEEAYAALILPPLNQHFDRTWVAHIQLKAAQFQAEALYRTSVDLHENENIAEEIARLKAATTILADAKKNGRGVVGPLMDAIVKLEGSVARNLERALKENDRVYLMRVPDNASLPPIQGANLVKSTPQAEVLDASHEKMFSGLVPDSSAKALSKYTEMVDSVIRTQAEKLQNESDLARVRLKEMDLPDALLALDGTPPLPEKLRDDIEAVDGGPASLLGEMSQLRDLRRVNEELLVQAEEALEKESREDAQIRQQFGTRWTRPQSSTLTKNLHDRATAFAANLRQAGESDAKIERSIKDNEQLMAILTHQPIEAVLPKLSRPILSIHGNEEDIASRLRQLLAELEQVGSQRAGLEDMLKDMKRKRELARYEPITAQVARNIEAQGQLLQQIKRSDVTAMDSITNLEQQYALWDAITNLKQQCGDYVMTRSIQCREMMEDLQRQIAGLSFRDAQPGGGSGGGGFLQGPAAFLQNLGGLFGGPKGSGPGQQQHAGQTPPPYDMPPQQGGAYGAASQHQQPPSHYYQAPQGGGYAAYGQAQGQGQGQGQGQSQSSLLPHGAPPAQGSYGGYHAPQPGQQAQWPGSSYAPSHTAPSGLPQGSQYPPAYQQPGSYYRQP